MPTTYSQPGVYNALDAFPGASVGMQLNDTSGGINNAIALQAAINAATGENGGIVLIPATDSTFASGSYQIAFNSSLTTITVPATSRSQPLLICGTANATRLLVETDAATLFTIDGNSETTFADLTIQWDQANDAATGTAFSFESGSGENENYRLFRVNVIDCQYPVNFLVGSVASMLECAIQYTDVYPTTQATIGISIGSFNHLTIEACTLALYAETEGSIGISIDNTDSSKSAAYPRIVDTSILLFDTGVSIGMGSAGAILGPMLTNLDITSFGSCIEIQGGNTSDVSLVNCELQAASDTAGPGIVVGTIGDDNKKIDTIRIVSCSASGFSNNGLEIRQGRNIQVIEGSYSGNGQTGGAGIAIAGAAVEIQVDGANCVGPSLASTSVQQYGIAISAGQDIQIVGADCSGNGSSGNSGAGVTITSSESYTPTDVRILGTSCIGEVLDETSSEQQYGISINGASSVYVEGCTLSGSISGGYGLFITAPTNVFASSCDCSGNPYGIGVTASCKDIYIDGCNLNTCSTGPLYVSTPGTLQVINCPGYNDQASSLGAPPAPGTAFNPTFFNYYGPIAFYISSAPGSTVSQIKINGVITHLLLGGFTLSAPAPNGSTYVGETAVITYSGSGVSFPYFLAIGK